MGVASWGYVEVSPEGSKKWQVYHELETGDVGRGKVTKLVFGKGSGSFASLFENRGLPADMSEEARKDYLEDQVIEHGPTVYREMFGHSHVYASELPDFLLEEFEPLHEAAQEYSQARLLVWFNQ